MVGIPPPQKFEHAVERVFPQPLCGFGIFQEAESCGEKGTNLLAAGKGSPLMGGLSLKGRGLPEGNEISIRALSGRITIAWRIQFEQI